MNWLVFAGSLGGVLLVAGAAWAFGLGGATFEDEAAAMREAEGHLIGFRAASARLTEDGAEVTGADGRTVTLRRLGARWVTHA